MSKQTPEGTAIWLWTRELIRRFGGTPIPLGDEPEPAPIPPMPPEVRRLVEWAEGAEAQMESDRGPSKTHPTEGEQIIAAVVRIYRSEP